MGEREQKRETLNPGGDGTAANGYSWDYYLLGGSREQLTLWKGLQTSDATFCSHPGTGSYVHLYPGEYLIYGVEYPGIREDVPRIRLFANNQMEYRITDHLASVRATLNNSGTVVTNTYDYAPFGDKLGGGAEARQGFNSREKDQEADLFNNGVRKLDDGEGRFTSIDPLWEKFPAWSPYQYGYNSPLTVTDPSGMQGVPIEDDNEIDPYWEGGGGGGGGGGGSMSAREFFTRAWNALFSTTKSTPGGAGAGPAATPNRSENPDLLPQPSPPPTSRPSTGRTGTSTTQNSKAADRAGKKFTPKGKEEVWRQNAEKKGGTNKCETCNTEVSKPKKHTKGVTPPSNEGHVDHVIPKSAGGAGSPSNGQLLCRECNLSKGSSMPSGTTSPRYTPLPATIPQ